MGHGTITWLDCSTYEGDVCNGIRHGAGIFRSNKTCTVYRGQWHKGQRHGKVRKNMSHVFAEFLKRISLNLVHNLIVIGDNVLQ